ncbi:MAG: hypothetical protein ABUL46_03580, partial [Chitinophaga rupis]
MKNSKWIRLLSIALFLGMISGMITGCKKGDTGPEGPQGPAGPDSVYSSPWITDLSPTYVPDDTLYELIPPLSAPSITQGILDSGIVLSYVNFGSGTNYDVVPV